MNAMRIAPLPSLCLLLVAASCSEASPTSAQTAACDSTIGQQVLAIVNDLRTVEGLAPLVVDLRLVAAAQGHSEDMADQDFSSHTGSSGSTAQDRIEAQDYPWNRWSENVAAGQRTASEVVAGWMSSAGHRANILSPDVQHVGIGYASKSGTLYGTYWTMNFGSTGEPHESGNGCHP